LRIDAKLIQKYCVTFGINWWRGETAVGQPEGLAIHVQLCLKAAYSRKNRTGQTGGLNRFPSVHPAYDLLKEMPLTFSFA